MPYIEPKIYYAKPGREQVQQYLYRNEGGVGQQEKSLITAFG